ncbi:MAG TPA: prepilin-type N-terminal cleavage/methylation domain-containing protein [Pseudolabrys sp.]|nr:prepilin-type N-terminal cleavage/methylation domain-containing protein [Pseudolabrys sp.]
MAQRPTLPAGRRDRDLRREGFTLIEIICVLAVIALLAAILLPRMPTGTFRPRLEAYAIEAAAMLSSDRNAAIRRHIEVSTSVDAQARSIRSGATGDLLHIPGDIVVDAILPDTCNRRTVISTVNFLPSGMSCGGSIMLTHSGSGYAIRVNWLTGAVDVVPYSAL